MKDQSTTAGDGLAVVPPALETVSVSKRFGGIRAVDGVSLQVQRGTIVGLIGPNGAGKTTLFDLLAGVQQPSGGRVLVDGRALREPRAHGRLSLGVGRTFQVPRPFAELTLLDNVMLGSQRQSGERVWPNWLTPRRVRAEERRAQERAHELLDFVSLARLAHKPARVLSGGQRKLLELARVLMADPATVLLDEPAAGVHPRLLEVVVDRVVALNGRGITFLIIEHNMDLVAALCTRLVVMAQGRLLCEGSPRDVVRDARVIDAYLGGVAA